MMPFDVQSASFLMLASFGSVYAVNLYRKFDSKTNLLISFLFAFAYSFVPADFGNVIANHVKDAYATAMTICGAYQFGSGIAKKINPPEV